MLAGLIPESVTVFDMPQLDDAAVSKPVRVHVVEWHGRTGGVTTGKNADMPAGHGDTAHHHIIFGDECVSLDS